jgi:hypothetical protein
VKERTSKLLLLVEAVICLVPVATTPKSYNGDDMYYLVVFVQSVQ